MKYRLVDSLMIWSNELCFYYGIGSSAMWISTLIGEFWHCPFGTVHLIKNQGPFPLAAIWIFSNEGAKSRHSVCPLWICFGWYEVQCSIYFYYDLQLTLTKGTHCIWYTLKRHDKQRFRYLFTIVNIRSPQITNINYLLPEIWLLSQHLSAFSKTASTTLMW